MNSLPRSHPLSITHEQLAALRSISTDNHSDGGYVDLTRLCKAFGKHARVILSYKRIKNRLKFWAHKNGVDLKTLTATSAGGNVWCHRLLAIECARWLSVELDVYCDSTIHFEPTATHRKFTVALRALEDLKAAEAPDSDLLPKRIRRVRAIF